MINTTIIECKRVKKKKVTKTFPNDLYINTRYKIIIVIKITCIAMSMQFSRKPVIML